MLVLKTGGDFKLKDVQLLATNILRPYVKNKDLQAPNIYCITDLVNKLTKLKDVTLLPLEYDWPGWWSKMNLFSPALEQYRPFLYMDLDSAVVGDIATIMPGKDRENEPIILSDFYFPERQGSALMWIPKSSDEICSIWTKWINNPKRHIGKYRGDQNFIYSTEIFKTTWQSFIPNRISSFKPIRGTRLSRLIPGLVLVCFHGIPRVWEAAESVEWVRQYVTHGINNPEKAPEIIKESKKPALDVSNGAIPIVLHPTFSILCPTRGRPDMAVQFIESFYTHAAYPEMVEILLYIDFDDPLLSEYIKKTSGMSSKIMVGASKGVGKAWNALAKSSTGQYLMMGNDDLVCETWGWDKLLLQKFVRYPDGIFLAYTNDGINKNGAKCCFPIVGRNWYEKLGMFVPECYKFFYHDTALHDIAKQIEHNRILYFPDIMFRHKHAGDIRPTDPTHIRNRMAGQNREDSKIFASFEDRKERRRKAKCLSRAITEMQNVGAQKLRELVYGKKIALVGPSPHLMNKKIGKLIDTYDIVCRVNEFFPFGQEQDYGSRTNILFYGCNANNFNNFEKSIYKAKKENPKLLEQLNIFISTQYRKNEINIFSQQDFIHLLKMNTPHTILGALGITSWDYYTWWIGTQPNTGILALCMLANEEPSELFLTGFSFYSQGTAPNQLHHSAYVEYGGDNKGVPWRGHNQNMQKQWFINKFIPSYSSILTLDSFLCETLTISADTIGGVVKL